VTGDTVLIGSYDSNLYALAAKTGKLQWKVRTDGYVHATPSVVDGVAYITGCDEILRGIRIRDGRQLFMLSSGAYTGASPAISNGRAFYGTYENEVLAVDLKLHKIVWRYRHPERNFPFYSSAALSAGRVFVGGRDKLMHALDAASGKEVWSFQTGARIDSSPALAGTRGYVGSNDGKLYVFDTSSGKIVQQFDAGGGGNIGTSGSSPSSRD
jgi:outer membrane protein assembly factor BamB